MHILNDFYQKNNNKFNIFIIYINEAHAADVWNIGESAGAINYSHKELQDRIKYAENFKNEYNLTIPIYCDNINDDFENELACWPVRIFIIFNKKFKLISEPSDSEIDVCVIFDSLNKI